MLYPARVRFRNTCVTLGSFSYSTTIYFSFSNTAIIINIIIIIINMDRLLYNIIQYGLDLPT